MSTSACSVKSGIVAFDSAIRWAIWTWVREGSSRVTTPLAPRAGTAAELRLRDRLEVGLHDPAAGPDPLSARRSIWDSRAIRRASGEARTRPAPWRLSASDALPAAARCRRGGARSGGRRRLRTALGRRRCARSARRPATVSPSPARIRKRPVGVRVERDRRLVGFDLGERLALRDDCRRRSSASGRSCPPPSSPTAAASRPQAWPAHPPTRSRHARATAAAIAPAPGMNASSSVGL